MYEKVINNEEHHIKKIEEIEMTESKQTSKSNNIQYYNIEA